VRAGNLRTYRPLLHQHTPEIEDTLRVAGARNLTLEFVPVSAPLVRGIFATSFIRVPAEISEEQLKACLESSYRQERFVRIPARRLPEVVAVAGSNYAEVGLAFGAVAAGVRAVTVFSCLDNLVKGGAGQAIQNMNLMLGLPESLTLEAPGAYP
jgi:N-acetyl-gamma-glutamyl-phosphate reductase